jgi:hypothetical protein
MNSQQAATNNAQPGNQPIAAWSGAATTPERFAAIDEADQINAEMIHLRQIVDAAMVRASELARLVAGPTSLREKAAAYRELATICELSDDIARRRDKAMERLRALGVKGV